MGFEWDLIEFEYRPAGNIIDKLPRLISGDSNWDVHPRNCGS